MAEAPIIGTSVDRLNTVQQEKLVIVSGIQAAIAADWERKWSKDKSVTTYLKNGSDKVGWGDLPSWLRAEHTLFSLSMLIGNNESWRDLTDDLELVKRLKSVFPKLDVDQFGDCVELLAIVAKRVYTSEGGHTNQVNQQVLAKIDLAEQNLNPEEKMIVEVLNKGEFLVRDMVENRGELIGMITKQDILGKKF